MGKFGAGATTSEDAILTSPRLRTEFGIAGDGGATPGNPGAFPAVRSEENVMIFGAGPIPEG
jgi:hypothetical protein